MIKLVIEHGVVEGEVAKLLLLSDIQPGPSPSTKAAPFSSKDYQLVDRR